MLNLQANRYRMQIKSTYKINEHSGHVVVTDVMECDCTHRRFNVMRADNKNIIKCVRCGKRYIYADTTKQYIAE